MGNGSVLSRPQKGMLEEIGIGEDLLWEFTSCQDQEFTLLGLVSCCNLQGGARLSDSPGADLWSVPLSRNKHVGGLL